MKVKTFFKILLSTTLMCSMLVPFFALSASAEESSENPLYKKSALFIGDSICNGVHDYDSTYNEYGWAGRIGDNNEMTYVNAGQNGWYLAKDAAYPNRQILLQMTSNGNPLYDYVIMHGGVNDAQASHPIGTLTEGFATTKAEALAAYDQTTVAGALEYMFFYAKSTYKLAKIGYIINYSMPNASKGGSPNYPKSLEDMTEYVNIIKAACEKWDIEYLDLYNDTDFCQNVLKTDTLTHLSDYLHPTSSGYDLLAPKIEAWMKTLGQEKPAETEPQDTEPAQTTTTAPETTTPVEEKGCSSTLTLGGIFTAAIATLAGAALMFRRRKITER